MLGPLGFWEHQAAWVADLVSDLALRDFAHVNVYPDMQAFMKRHKWLSHDSGWKLRDDYISSYADCRGDEAFVEDVLYRVQ